MPRTSYPECGYSLQQAVRGKWFKRSLEFLHVYSSYVVSSHFMKRLLLLATLLVAFPVTGYAKKTLRIESEPSGARVEINGEFVGTTPVVREKVKDFMFQGPLYAWSEYLATPLQLTISKEGYVTKTIIITNGPFVWVNGNYTVRKDFYVISSTVWNIKLDPVGEFLGSNPLSATSISSSNSPMTGLALAGESKVKLSTEEIVQRALPAVVTLKTGGGAGSGFFITETGVIVTNKHVVEGSQTVSVITGKGESVSSDSIFVHPIKDLALVKVKGSSFPYLKVANPATVNVGADVVAIGSPAVGVGTLPNTVTKGVISAFRNAAEYGIYIQTDVQINPGNSGGPLLNSNAEVVGVNSMKISAPGYSGLNFSLFSSEILQMLKEHFSYVPEYANTSPSSPKDQEGKVAVDISSEPSGAEIYVDGTFTSSTPSKLLLSVGEHTIKVMRPGFTDWERKIVVDAGSSKTLNAILEKKTP